MEEEKQSYYVVIPMPIFEDKDLAPSEKLLYGLISSLVNKDGYCFASNEYLSKKMNINEVNISKTLKKMKDKGYLVIIYTYNGNVIKNRKIYIDEPLSQTTTVAVIENDKTAVIANDKDNNKAIKGSNKYIIKEIYKEKFDVFWLTYPKKLKKSEVINWFNKSNMTDELFKEIMDKLKLFIKSDDWKDIKYIPYPSTWLNQKRWEDEIEEKQPIESTPPKELDEETIDIINNFDWLNGEEE